MAKKSGGDIRIVVNLACEECKRKNYSTTKNKRNTQARLELKKYCPWDKKVTLHKGSK